MRPFFEREGACYVVVLGHAAWSHELPVYIHLLLTLNRYSKLPTSWNLYIREEALCSSQESHRQDKSTGYDEFPI